MKPRNFDESPTNLVSSRLPFIRLFIQNNHQVDDKLLQECAYYPRQGCEKCRWEYPLTTCPVAHILVDTRCGGIEGWRAGARVVRERERDVWATLPTFVKERILQLIKEEEVKT